jgi:hypothetical protein
MVTLLSACVDGDRDARGRRLGVSRAVGKPVGEGRQDRNVRGQRGNVRGRAGT